MEKGMRTVILFQKKIFKEYAYISVDNRVGYGEYLKFVINKWKINSKKK